MTNFIVHPVDLNFKSPRTQECVQSIVSIFNKTITSPKVRQDFITALRKLKESWEEDHSNLADLSKRLEAFYSHPDFSVLSMVEKAIAASSAEVTGSRSWTVSPEEFWNLISSEYQKTHSPTHTDLMVTPESIPDQDDTGRTEESVSDSRDQGVSSEG